MKRRHVGASIQGVPYKRLARCDVCDGHGAFAFDDGEKLCPTCLRKAVEAFGKTKEKS